MADDTNTTEEDGPKTAPSGNDPATEGAAGGAASGGETGAGAGDSGDAESGGEAEAGAGAEAASSSATKSRLVKLAEKLGGAEVGTQIGSLVDIWNDEGISPEEVQKIVDDLAKRDEERQATLEALADKIKDINDQIGSKMELIKQSELAIAAIDQEIDRIEQKIEEASQKTNEGMQETQRRKDALAKLKAEFAKMREDAVEP